MIDSRQKKSALERIELERKFLELVEQWRRETLGISSTDDLIEHPAFQGIVQMGEKVIPLLLKELEKKSGRWFYVLDEITGEDPVLPEHRGCTEKMVEDWLEWGQINGYRW